MRVLVTEGVGVGVKVNCKVGEEDKVFVTIGVGV
jgi:hypothetical protein